MNILMGDGKIGIFGVITGGGDVKNAAKTRNSAVYYDPMKKNEREEFLLFSFGDFFFWNGPFIFINLSHPNYPSEVHERFLL